MYVRPILTKQTFMNLNIDFEKKSNVLYLMLYFTILKKVNNISFFFLSSSSVMFYLFIFIHTKPLGHIELNPNKDFISK